MVICEICGLEKEKYHTMIHHNPAKRTEVRKKISEKAKFYKQRLGQKYPQKELDKKSKSMKKYWKNLNVDKKKEICNKISKSHLGKKETIEQTQNRTKNHSQLMKNWWKNLSDEKKIQRSKKLSKSLTGKIKKPVTMKTKKKLSIAIKKQWDNLDSNFHSEKRSLKLSNSLENYWKSLSVKERQILKENHVMGKGLNIGIFETPILDTIEKLHNIKIERQYNVKGYFVDGYCQEINTVFEIDEPNHNTLKQKEKDRIRQSIIENYLKCKFIRIKIPTQIYKMRKEIKQTNQMETIINNQIEVNC